MRIPKYQAWHKAEKRMFTVYYLSWLGGIFLIGDKNAETSRRFGSGEVELREFTGLHDKHGKEIFEGDIVRIDEEEGVFPVTWGKFEDCCVEGETWILGDFWQPTLHYHHEDAEIVGNIYETPELLKNE